MYRAYLGLDLFGVKGRSEKEGGERKRTGKREAKEGARWSDSTPDLGKFNPGSNQKKTDKSSGKVRLIHSKTDMMPLVTGFHFRNHLTSMAYTIVNQAKPRSRQGLTRTSRSSSRSCSSSSPCQPHILTWKRQHGGL